MRYIVAYILLINIIISLSFASEDPLKDAISISQSGAEFQSARIKVAAENLANQNSTALTPGGTPYARKRIFAGKKHNSKDDVDLVVVKKYDRDRENFLLKYEPGHPAADENGYVKYPYIHQEIEKADSLEAAKSYEANLSTIDIAKSMMQKTLELIK